MVMRSGKIKIRLGKIGVALINIITKVRSGALARLLPKLLTKVTHESGCISLHLHVTTLIGRVITYLYSLLDCASDGSIMVDFS